MTVIKSSSISSTKNTQASSSNKFSCLSHNLDEFPVLSHPKGPTSADVIREKSVHEVVGIPPLNLDVLVEDIPYEEEGYVPVLEVIAEEPSVIPEDAAPGLLQFTAAEVKVELDYWKHSVYCFILGANPPWDIVEGFIRRLWINHQVDMLSFLPNGVFLVRFKSRAAREAVLKQGHFLFDNKPLIVRPWSPEIELVKHEVKSVPVWIRLLNLPLKFWGKGIAHISGLVGKFIKCDIATEERTRLGYARAMIEMNLGDPLHDKGVGHSTEDCRKKNQKPKSAVPAKQPAPAKQPVVNKVWRPKAATGGQRQKSHVNVAQTPVATVPVDVPLTTPVVWHKDGTYTMGFTPARPIVRMTRQENSDGGYSVHKFGQQTFLEALNKSGSPKEGIGTSGSAPHQHNVGLFGLLETKVKALSQNSISGIVIDGWSLTTNNSCHKGGRVWVLWNPSIFQVDIVNYSAQCINMKVVEIASNKLFYLSMVYVFNDLQARESLWEQLINFASVVDGAWAVCGDFNCVLSHSERLGGSSTDAEIDAFQGCLTSCGLVDSPAMGSFFTWNNKQEVNARVYSRLDRFLINSDWSCSMSDNYAHFLPEGNFDHTPCILKKADDFLLPIGLSNIFRCGGNLLFFFLGWLFGGMLNSLCAAIALKNLEFIQSKIALDPTNVDWLVKEAPAAKEFSELQQACHLFLSQKAKAAWLKDGDQNTKYFHGVIRSKFMRNQVLAIKDLHGVEHTDPIRIQNAFLEFYINFLGTETVTEKVNARIIQTGRTCTEEQATGLLLPVTKKEIKDAIFSIPDHKAPGPDGFSSSFYKDAWSIIGDEMPTQVTQFRPIACCNVVYKCISKLICNRLSTVLPELVSVNKGGFVKGRSIIENILVCQDLVRLYNRQACSPRCMFKIDLMKAYDSVSWTFLDELLEAFRFPKHFRGLIMECVGSASYSITLNGDTFGFFKGKKGLRQGDPMSPLLFTLCMEYLSRILTCATGKLKFHYHPLCKQLKLSHLMFADDLLMFCKGDAASMMVLLRAFSSFSLASGLKMNSTKSEVYFNGVPATLRKDILSISGFIEGQLPFKYLGVPITAGRLKKNDCAVLIDKIVERIRSLGAKKLSYAGRLTLVESVLVTMHRYWASIFVLPKGVLSRVDAIYRNFLWEGHAEYNSVPRVAWHKVCVPKIEGGLGLKDSHVWNVATIGKLVWWLVVKPDKLWVDGYTIST
ncbi:uncharacterized protein LOC141631922 [Silene latifolia]|uniref:uncharacterized protein LOC141631922 n=1 Tax=Silene latifolia TaxID=37657 RepID=UPI003D785D4C